MAWMDKKISVILPCLNEERALAACLDELRAVLPASSAFEVIVVDNGSSDGSAVVLARYREGFPQLKVVEERRRGYGFAYLRGLEEVSGEYIFMTDADGTYDLSALPDFMSALEKGADLVVGNRFAGRMSRQAMPWSHRYIGNPFLSWFARLLSKIKVKDVHCGARALRADCLPRLSLRTGGMEFASEMLIKAARAGLVVGEVPVSYRCRIGESKLKTVPDGWRHLRFMLLYSPAALFFLPGSLLFGLGALLLVFFLVANPVVFGRSFDVHPLFVFSLMIFLGYQLIIFGGFAKVYALNHFQEGSPALEKLFRWITIERAGLAGILLILIGAALYILIFASWANNGFGALNLIKESIVGLTLMMLGAQTFFSAFMFSILGIKEK